MSSYFLKNGEIPSNKYKIKGLKHMAIAPDSDPSVEQIEQRSALVDVPPGAEPEGVPQDDDTLMLLNDARQQQTYSDQRKQVNNGDWRVRLSLAPGADYLYKDDTNKILAPLALTNGVIFPYTPSITTAYRANYAAYDLTHANYKGYYYQNSHVDPVTIGCTFTAQNTSQANYLLAVIHFFKSATKMFYGQDAQRGVPPPLVFLTGLGEYQFNGHPAVISSFTYNLPPDVDYIRAGSPNTAGGLDLTTRRQRQDVASNAIFTQIQRLASAFTTKGALPAKPPIPNLGLNSPTYVPTKIDISISLNPIQSRQQMSQEFSLKEFANGELIRKGFW
jgi:hypothetical protein